MKTVYVVMGYTGEYSDNREWPVCAFFDEEKAKERVVLAGERAREIFSKYKDILWDSEIEPNEYDPHMDMDYTGTSYFYHTVEVVE